MCNSKNNFKTRNLQDIDIFMIFCERYVPRL